MAAQKMAEILERLADAINVAADNFRGVAEDNVFRDAPDVGLGNEIAEAEMPWNRPKRDTADRNTSEDTLLQVPAGDLWRLVNRSRKMIRLAREGKVPNMEARAPLCRSIKALKQQGLVRKPHDLRN